MTRTPHIRPQWTADQVPDQTGRTFVVTGANSGLGYEMTQQLARRGAHVVMAVRNLDRGQAAAARITAELPAARLDVRRIDLGDLDSVRSFADRLHADGVAIDVLVNNAGIMMPPYSRSPQGYERQFATNHLGHFALTGLLLDAISGERDPRIVTVTSFLHKMGTLDFDNLDGARGYRGVRFYAQSKLANALFGLELDRRLRAVASPIRSVLAHPGYANTPLQSTGPGGIRTQLLKLAGKLMAQSAGQGALSQLYAATVPDVRGGQLIGPDGKGERSGFPTVVHPSDTAMDPDLARHLWEVSEKLTGVRYELPVPVDMTA
ncbi:MAG: SDR family NAD(P)-dependent oxidoreductase [Chloroflexia bacterium]|nr:SDR family NAD(P)-dependent oxidoreductase [Chloroflexia bacterium]